jgi:hypothetical protein
MDDAIGLAEALLGLDGLPCFGRPARQVWLRRCWDCSDADCAAKTWTEGSDHVAPRAVITLRAGMESTRQVGELGRSVAEVARELGRPATCANGARPRTGPGWAPSRWWPPTSPSTTGPACPHTSTTPCGWPTPFHVVRAGNCCLDTVRRRVQNETLGHRGWKDDPLYRIRKLLLSGAERVDEKGQCGDSC